MSERSYGRSPAEMRPTEIEPGFVRPASGSALISVGETRVICTASVQESVPRWMAGRGRGWVTAEYGMLPASTGDRKQRDATKGRQDGRTVEIQRLIGRSLRGVVDFDALGERTIYLDCDVLQADGGTRCASITGAYVALALACERLRGDGLLERSPLSGSVAAISCGMVGGDALLDLDYSEDSTAEVDAERRDDRRRRPGRGAGHRRAHTALTARAWTSCSRSPPTASSSCASCSSGPSPRRPPPSFPGVRLLLATHNAHKRREFQRLLAGGEVQIDMLADDFVLPPEDGETFAENALGKARAAARGSGRASIADDSGIESAALTGAPGVRSARFAGEQASDRENLDRLLRDAPAGSALRYVCVIAYVDPASGVERLFEGTCGGRLDPRPRGERGFGYDPAFLPDDGPEGMTMAELSDVQKDAISHRGIAARALRRWLEQVDRG